MHTCIFFYFFLYFSFIIFQPLACDQCSSGIPSCVVLKLYNGCHYILMTRYILYGLIIYLVQNYCILCTADYRWSGKCLTTKDWRCSTLSDWWLFYGSQANKGGIGPLAASGPPGTSMIDQNGDQKSYHSYGRVQSHPIQRVNGAMWTYLGIRLNPWVHRDKTDKMDRLTLMCCGSNQCQPSISL